VLPHEHDATRALVERAMSSHRAASGRPLIALDGSRRSVARQLWDAPIACVVVGDALRGAEDAAVGAADGGSAAAGDEAAAGDGAARGAAGGGAEGATTLAGVPIHLAGPTYLYANRLACEVHGAARAPSPSSSHQPQPQP